MSAAQRKRRTIAAPVNSRSVELRSSGVSGCSDSMTVSNELLSTARWVDGPQTHSLTGRSGSTPLRRAIASRLERLRPSLLLVGQLGTGAPVLGSVMTRNPGRLRMTTCCR